MRCSATLVSSNGMFDRTRSIRRSSLTSGSHARPHAGAAPAVGAAREPPLAAVRARFGTGTCRSLHPAHPGPEHAVSHLRRQHRRTAPQGAGVWRSGEEGGGWPEAGFPIQPLQPSRMTAGRVWEPPAAVRSQPASSHAGADGWRRRWRSSMSSPGRPRRRSSSRCRYGHAAHLSRSTACVHCLRAPRGTPPLLHHLALSAKATLVGDAPPRPTLLALERSSRRRDAALRVSKSLASAALSKSSSHGQCCLGSRH